MTIEHSFQGIHVSKKVNTSSLIAGITDLDSEVYT